uniref:Putative DNA binding, helix-turn-helix domain containing protein n=1 Tax=viral metagenome TaxID=1070528 RepID=A0A6M3JL34_9ZZZZ
MKGKPTRGKAVDVAKAIELYEKGVSMNEIGRQLGHHHGVIAYHIHKSGTPIHNPRQQRNPISTDYIKELYEEGMSTIEIGETVGLTPQAIYGRLLKAGIPLRSFSEAITLAAKRGRKRQQAGELNAKWKGGRAIDSDGYVTVRINGRQYAEHRLVLEKKLGRTLTPSEIGHHLNGIRSDNRPENLIALPRKRHSPITIVTPHQERIKELELAIYKLQKEVK